jgi:hypothetical protein
MRLALDLGKRVIVLDNISCLFSGVDEDKAREWEKVKLWLLDMRRHRISPVLVHHTGYDLTHMRGTSSREDAASRVIRLDSKKDDFETLGAKFISRFSKYRGGKMVLDYEWTFEPSPTEPNKINVNYTIANRRRSCSNGFGTTDQLRRYRQGNGTDQRTRLTTRYSAYQGGETAKKKE